MAYALITPAYNEADSIVATMDSVIRQTRKPALWLIVDDGSTDDTLAVIDRYKRSYSWIHSCKRKKVSGQSYFSSNVYAIMEGVASLSDVAYNYLAILDADITLPDDYYERIIDKFEQDARLGVASGIYVNLIDGKECRVLSDRRSTPKAIQVFRRQCFEDIEGYRPLRHGGEDSCACVMARMAGWKTWSFPDIATVHRRPTGTGNAKTAIKARFHQGQAEYDFGSHPIFALGKGIKRSIYERPYVVGGMARLCGYLAGYLAHQKRETPPEVVRFLRREQLWRLVSRNRIPEALKCGASR